MELHSQLPSSHPLTAPVHPPERVTGAPELHHSEGRYHLEKLHAQDQREIKALKKELQRKEKALAEAAALLVLRKKWEAYCSEDEEG
jgi:hypothetical protein